MPNLVGQTVTIAVNADTKVSFKVTGALRGPATGDMAKVKAEACGTGSAMTLTADKVKAEAAAAATTATTLAAHKASKSHRATTSRTSKPPRPLRPSSERVPGRPCAVGYPLLARIPPSAQRVPRRTLAAGGTPPLT